MSAASLRVGAKRQMPSSVAWVSALIGLKLRLPQSLVHISLRTSLTTGALKPALAKASDTRRIRSLFEPSSLGEREAVALDVTNDAGSLDLRRRIDDAGDDAVDRQIVGDDAAGIDALEAHAFMRAAMAEKIPPGNAVLRRQHERFRVP